MQKIQLPTTDEIKRAFESLNETTAAYVKAETSWQKAEAVLHEWYVVILANGTIVGKNDNEREGNARMLRPDLYLAVDRAHDSERSAWANRECAKIQVRMLSTIIRLAEAQTGLYEIVDTEAAYSEQEGQYGETHG